MRHGDHHCFVLHTDDLATTGDFFSELLGWEVVDGELRNVAFFGAITESDERSLWAHVDDCDATATLVESLGGSIERVSDDRSGRNAICVDDQGNRFHLGTLLPELRDHPRPDPLPEGELAYVTLDVGDTGRAVDFYGRILGWEFTEPGETGAQVGYRHCTNGALPFGFTAGGDPGPTYYFRVADIARSADRVRELGGTAGETVDSEAGRSLIGNTDPTGVRFELWRPADGF